MILKTFRGKKAHDNYRIWLNQHFDDVKIQYDCCDYQWNDSNDVKIVFRLKPNRNLKEMI